MFSNLLQCPSLVFVTKKNLVFGPFLRGLWSDLAKNLWNYSVPFPIPLPSFVQNNECRSLLMLGMQSVTVSVFLRVLSVR